MRALSTRTQSDDGLNGLGSVGDAGNDVARCLEHAGEREQDVWMIISQHDSRPAKIASGRSRRILAIGHAKVAARP